MPTTEIDPTLPFEAAFEESLLQPDPTPEPTPTPTPVAPTPEPTPVAKEPTPTPPTPDAAPETVPASISDKLFKTLSGGAADTPETPTPAPTDAAEADAPPGPSTPAAQARWAEMRQHEKWRKQNEPVLTQLQAEVEELRKKIATPPPEAIAQSEEVKRLRAERDGFLQELQVSRVEATPEFKNNILRPMEGVLERGRAMAKRHQLDEGTVVRALQDPDETRRGAALAALATEFSEPDRMALYRLGDQLSEYRANADYLRQNAKLAMETLQKNQASEAEKRKSQMEAAWTSALEEVGTTYRTNLPLLQKIEGETDWNTGTDEIERLVRNTKLYQLPPKELAKVLYQAAVLPRALSIQEKLVSEVTQLRKRLSQYQTVTPGAGEGQRQAETAPASDEGLGFLEAIEK